MPRMFAASPRLYRLCRSLALASLVAATGSCAVGPHYLRPTAAVDAQADYGAVPAGITAAQPDDSWWERFGDPVLDQLVRIALRDNADLAAAEALVWRSREAVRVTDGALLPTLNAAGRVSDDKLSRNGENLALIPITPRTTEFTDYRVGFDASWEIDLAGHSRREVEASMARFGSALESRNDAQVVVAAEVVDAYSDYRVARRRRALALERVRDCEDAARLIGMQRVAGVVGDDALQRAQADVQGAMAVASGADAAVSIAVFRLQALTGRAPDSLRQLLADEQPIPAAPSTLPVGMPSDLLLRRPDVRRSERELAAATAEVGAAVAAQFPRLSLTGDIGFDSVRAGDLTQAASRYWNLAPQLVVPLFAGGRLRSQTRAAEAAREAALASYRSAVLRAFADAESGIVRFAAARDRAERLQSAATALAGTVASARQRYEAGDISMVDVLGSKRVADDATDQQLVAMGEFTREFVALNKALGGGWHAGRAH